MNAYESSPLGTPRYETYGSLRCLVIDGSAEPQIPVVLCHGYGAPGDDLASLTPHLAEWIGPASSAFRFIFPEAPGDLSELGMPDGRAWWPLNMMALQELLQTDQFSQLHNQQPPGIDEARGQLAEAIGEALKQMPGRQSPGDGTSEAAPIPYVIGGFSQGAMLTMDVALRSELPPPAMLVQFSGTLVCQDQWQAALPRLASTHVIQSHGRIDPILPFTSAEALRDVLKEGDVEVEFISFQGPHTIETDALFRLVERLRVMPEKL